MVDLAAALIVLETERCRCIVEQDYERLRQLLSPALIHTHTRGNTDDREAYIDFISRVVESLDLRREGLRVVPLGPDAAVMHGKQFNRARRRGTTELADVEAVVTQAWAREPDGQWRLVAFHATSVGALPPEVKR